MTTSTETAIRHQIDVAVPRDKAFAIFTKQWDKIKPYEHNPLPSPIVESVFEPRVGGAVYDRCEDGSELRWSRVLVFEPPRRFVITWDLSPQWQLETDPARCSEVEVTFVEIGEDRTRVELEHRHLDRHGPGWDGVRSGVDGADGWQRYLRRFAELTTG